MKKYQNIISQYPPEQVIQHAWGQTPAVIYSQVAHIWNQIAVGDVLAVVTRKSQGSKSIQAYLTAKNLRVSAAGKGQDGLRVLQIVKDRDVTLDGAVSPEIVEFQFGDATHRAHVGGALFSRKGLDVGTRKLLQAVVEARLDLTKAHVADLGAGWGAIAMVLEPLMPSGKLDLYENDPQSIVSAQQNTEGMDQVAVHAADILTKDFYDQPQLRAAYDYVICNPPFHITDQQREQLFAGIKRILKPQGELFFVVERHFAARFGTSAATYLRQISATQTGRFTVYRYMSKRKPATTPQ